MEILKNLTLGQKFALASLGFLLIALPLGVFVALTNTFFYNKAAHTEEFVSLSVSSGSTAVKLGDEFQIKIEMGADSEYIKLVAGAEIHLTFDPKIIEAKEVQMGEFLPVILDGPTIDNTSGKVSFVVGVKPGEPLNKDYGSLANVIFTAKEVGSGTFKFAKESRVAAIGYSGSVLSNPGGTVATYTVLPPTPTPTPTETPTPTLGPTGSPTPTSTPTLTPTLTPTPTSTPSPTSATFHLTFQGVSEKRADQDVEISWRGASASSGATVRMSADNNGTYSGTVNDLEPGSYNFYAKGQAHLKKALGTFTLEFGSNIVNATDKPLLPGDLDGNGTTDILDFAFFVEEFGQNPGSKADFDLDGEVSILDFAYFVDNFEKEDDA